MDAIDSYSSDDEFDGYLDTSAESSTVTTKETTMEQITVAQNTYATVTMLPSETIL